MRALALVAILAAGPAAGQYVSQNHAWEAVCNPSGYALTSRDRVVRFFEGGANSRVTDGRETLYLGKSCDAYHAEFGEGRWCWANGGFRAEFADTIFGFPRQEISCPDGDIDLGLHCSC
ncbi:hypothetical protein ACQ5SO_03120 [Rhodovulum sp. DZ06]|uniref:hypothetical protein n=1 Tax=Rhodovulum sp. DZ06 TaxID=3425126 RepID=UPI003D3473EE